MASIEYHEDGEGIPVVFSHGAGSDLRFWEQQRRAFAEKYRFVAYSRRSFGSSEAGPDGGASADDHADDLVALIRHLQAGPVHLVGFSAATALLAALAAPDFLRTLTIVEPNVPSLEAVGHIGVCVCRLAWLFRPQFGGPPKLVLQAEMRNRATQDGICLDRADARRDHWLRLVAKRRSGGRAEKSRDEIRLLAQLLRDFVSIPQVDLQVRVS